MTMLKAQRRQATKRFFAVGLDEEGRYEALECLYQGQKSDGRVIVLAVAEGVLVTTNQESLYVDREAAEQEALNLTLQRRLNR